METISTREVPSGKSDAAWSKYRGELDKLSDGNGGSVVVQMDSDPNFRRRMARFGLAGGYPPPADERLVRAIMGDESCFLSADWASAFGVRITKKLLRGIGGFPWHEDILNGPCPFVNGKRVRDTHFAFIGLEDVGGAVTIGRFQVLHPQNGQPRFCSYPPDCWYDDQAFATERTLRARWYLMLKDIVPKSTSTTYADQEAMLPDEYELPWAVEEVAKDLFAVRKGGVGVYLNHNVYARCQDKTTPHGLRVSVGFDENGLFVGGSLDRGLYLVGAGASRKLPKAA